MNEGEKVRRTETRGGLLPPRALLLSLLVQAPLMIWSWPPKPATVPVLLGVAMLVAGAVLNIWADRLFRKKGVGVCPFSPTPALVREGPYRFTRNPMYLGMVLTSTCAPLLTGVYLNLLPALVLAIWLHVRFVLPEEEFLRYQLGTEYLLYASLAPRWLGLPGPALREQAPAQRRTR
jgi:protein-S-isoprenylcysteine O-methyltransferase Ste14